MGVDAQMLVRTMKAYTDIELRRISGRLCATVGREHFMIMRPDRGGVFSPEYIREYYGLNGQHALTIKSSTVASYLVEAREYGDIEEVKRLELLDQSRPIYAQDGEPLIGEVGEQFIDVHLFTRYYGVGYERGNWPVIRAVAEFLEHAFEGGIVYYGGDSSGVCAAPFDAAARGALNKHYLSVGHEPYRGYRLPQESAASYPSCAFCGGREMNNTGGGAEFTFYSCDGCGARVVGNGKPFGPGSTDYEPLTADEARDDNWSGYQTAVARLKARTG